MGRKKRRKLPVNGSTFIDAAFIVPQLQQGMAGVLGSNLGAATGARPQGSVQLSAASIEALQSYTTERLEMLGKQVILGVDPAKTPDKSTRKEEVAERPELGAPLPALSVEAIPESMRTSWTEYQQRIGRYADIAGWRTRLISPSFFRTSPADTAFALNIAEQFLMQHVRMAGYEPTIWRPLTIKMRPSPLEAAEMALIRLGISLRASAGLDNWLTSHRRWGGWWGEPRTLAVELQNAIHGTLRPDKAVPKNLIFAWEEPRCPLSAVVHAWWLDELNTLNLVDFPLIFKVDEQQRLHCPDGPAIVYQDGTSGYAYHGIIMTKSHIERQFTAQDIFNEANTEVRRAMLDLYGYERLHKEGLLNELQRDEAGRLYSLGSGPGRENMRLVGVRNSTSEPDGTHKIYFLRVPPWISRAKEGVAWTFNMSEDDYRPEKET
jgi:hypothetical protein